MKKIGYDNAIGLIKIIALLKIVTLHFARWWGVYIPLFYFNGFSLRLFVIASGFGFTKLFESRKKSFFVIIWHQLKKIYICMTLALVTILVALSFKQSVDYLAYILDVVRVGLGSHVEEVVVLLTKFGVEISHYPITNGSQWFISLIIWLYLLFPLIYLLFKRINPFVVLSGLLYCSYFLSKGFDPSYKSVVYNLFYFGCGVFFAMNYFKVREILNNWWVIGSLPIVTWIIYQQSFTSKFYHFIFELFLFLTLYIVFSLDFFKTLKWVKEYDKVVFFAYLIHQPLTALLPFLMWSSGYSHLQNFVYYFLYLFMVILVSIVLLKIFKKIYSFERWSDLIKQFS